VSYLALVTDRFDEVVHFYGELLGFPVVEEWDRGNARGLRFDTGGMRLEIIDNARERQQLELGQAADRVHIVIEVDDIDASRDGIAVNASQVVQTSWGSRLFQVHDPDGIPITYLQWLKAGEGGE
jgi:catechol 2,3-dioxygenase-like lactoylglutathione lyase family enzyme